MRDLQVRANISFKQGDEDSRPNRLEPQHNRGAIEVVGQSNSAAELLHTSSLTQNRKQKSILDFFAPVIERLDLPSTSTGVQQGQERVIETQGAVVTGSEKAKPHLTSKKNRGFNFCNVFNCRYCKLINKSGSITSKVTKK